MRGQFELWDQAVAFTREKSPATFDQWFCGVQFDGLTEGVLSLRARDEFVREWVEEHFVPTLADFLSGHSGFNVQVAWTIDVSLQPGNSSYTGSTSAKASANTGGSSLNFPSVR